MSKRAPPLSAPTEYDRELDQIEPAWSKAAYGFRTGIRYGHEGNERRTLSLIHERCAPDPERDIRDLVSVHEHLEARRLKFAAGDKLEVLHALRFCCAENVPAPTWLARAFDEAMRAFLAPIGATMSLDDVFSSADLPTKGKRARKARDDWSTAVRIWRQTRIVRLKRSRRGTSFDEGMSFDTALGIALDALHELCPEQAWPGRTKARKLVMRVERQVLVAAKAFSHLSQKPRKL